MDDVDRHFNFLDGSLLNANPAVLRFDRPPGNQMMANIPFSTDKARKRGWNGYVDSYEGMLEVFEELVELKMIPPVPKTKVSFS